MWWGVYAGEPPHEIANEAFIIRLHADNSGQPGAVLATFNTGALTTSRTATGRTVSPNFYWEPFELTETADITRISWWGGYYNSQYYPLPGTDNFTVHIFADNGGQPGALIAMRFGWEYSEYTYANGSGLYSSFADPVVGPWQHWGDSSPGMAFRLDR